MSDLLDMLNKDVAENIKTCSQYFWLLHMYVQMVRTDNHYRPYQSGIGGRRMDVLIEMIEIRSHWLKRGNSREMYTFLVSMQRCNHCQNTGLLSFLK